MPRSLEKESYIVHVLGDRRLYRIVTSGCPYCHFAAHHFAIEAEPGDVRYICMGRGEEHVHAVTFNDDSVNGSTFYMTCDCVDPRIARNVMRAAPN